MPDGKDKEAQFINFRVNCGRTVEIEEELCYDQE